MDRHSAAAEIVSSRGSINRSLEIDTRKRRAAEWMVDGTLADSFPASDPPSWNPGIARPAGNAPSRVTAVSGRGVTDPGRMTVIDVSRPNTEPTFLQGLASLAGGSAVALIVPVVVLAIGLPFAIAIRALLHLIGLVFGVVVR